MNSVFAVNSNFNDLNTLINDNDNCSNVIDLQNDFIRSDNEINNSLFVDGIYINHDVIINGNGYFIDSCCEGRIFLVENCSLVLNNVILKNGYVYDFGGAIYANYSNLTFNNVLFYNNTAFVGGCICVNNSFIDCNDVVFDFNRAYIASAISILSRDFFDSRGCSFINNYALYAENIFSRGDVLIYWDSSFSNLNIILDKFVINYDDVKEDVDYSFGNGKIIVIGNDGIINHLKTICINESILSDDDFKNIMNGVALNQIFYVSNIDELYFVFDKLDKFYNLLCSNYYECYKELNFKNSHNISANIVLLPGVYNATKSLSLGFRNINKNMTIVIYGNDQIIDCSNLNDDFLFVVGSSSTLVLNNVTVCNAYSNNNNLQGIIYNEGFLFMNYCNFSNNKIINPMRIDMIKVPNGTLNLDEFNHPIFGFNIINKTRYLEGYLIFSSGNLYIGNEVNFINNVVKDDLILNSRYVFLVGDYINFINNTIIKGSVFKNAMCAFIDIYVLNFINNSVKNSVIYNYGYLGMIGNNFTFVNNTGNIIYQTYNNLNDYGSNNVFNNFTLFNSITDKNLKEFARLFWLLNLNSIFNINSDGIYMKVDNLLFDNNKGFSGSSIYIDKGNVSIVSKSLIFNNNYVDNDGGAIYVYNGFLNVFSSSVLFVNNSAVNGGAVYNNGVLNLFGFNISFINNSAVNGGAVYNNNMFNIDSYFVLFNFNNAIKGGGLYCNNSVINMTGSIDYVNNTDLNEVSQNYYFTSNSLFIINNHQISYNTASVLTYITEYTNCSGCRMNDKELSKYLRNISSIEYESNLNNINNNFIVEENSLLSSNDSLCDELNFNNNLTDVEISLLINNSINLFKEGNYKSYTVCVNSTNFDNNLVSSIIHFQYISNETDLINFHDYVICNNVRWTILYLIFANNTVFNLNPDLYNEDYFLGNIADYIYIEGNNCTFKTIYSSLHEDYTVITPTTLGGAHRYINKLYNDPLYFIQIESTQYVTINNLNFDCYQAGAIKNKGFCLVNNCTFKNNNHISKNFIETKEIIYNFGFLKCDDCIFSNITIGIKNNDGSIFVINNTVFKNNDYDVWNNQGDVGIQHNIQNSSNIKIHTNDVSKESKIHFYVNFVNSIIITAIASAVGGVVASAVVTHYTIISTTTATLVGIGVGAITGTAVGAATGFVLGMSEGICMNAIFNREIFGKSTLAYAKMGAINGAINGAIGGAIGGGVAGYKTVYKNIEKIIKLSKENINKLSKENINKLSKILSQKYVTSDHMPKFESSDPEIKNFMDSIKDLSPEEQVIKLQEKAITYEPNAYKINWNDVVERGDGSLYLDNLKTISKIKAKGEDPINLVYEQLYTTIKTKDALTLQAINSNVDQFNSILTIFRELEDNHFVTELEFMLNHDVLKIDGNKLIGYDGFVIFDDISEILESEEEFSGFHMQVLNSKLNGYIRNNLKIDINDPYMIWIGKPNRIYNYFPPMSVDDVVNAMPYIKEHMETVFYIPKPNLLVPDSLVVG